MKKIQISTLLAFLIMFGCSKDDMANTEQDSAVFEEGNLTWVNGERRTKINSGISSIVFYSNSMVNTNFVNGCLPTGKFLLKQGSFSGNLSGFGKLNANLSRYEITLCEELPADTPPECGYTVMYTLVASGKLALGSRDYCNITITGNIYPWYYDQFGYYGGQFDGTAITSSGVGKLKGLNNKTFTVYNNYANGPTINLETGTIALRISDFGQ